MMIAGMATNGTALALSIESPQDTTLIGFALESECAVLRVDLSSGVFYFRRETVEFYYHHGDALDHLLKLTRPELLPHAPVVPKPQKTRRKRQAETTGELPIETREEAEHVDED